ncbi:MAG: septation protein SpoVG family protein [Planctomycetota bacterium JB042]
MRISEVRVKLVDNRSEKLQAFCTMTVEGEFVVRDIKIIDGARGPFIAMPSRKLTDRCGRCGIKNHLRAKYCNECGNRLASNRAKSDGRGRARLHTDIAHPINANCRQFMEQTILEAFHAEVEKAKSPGYVAPDLEDFDDGYDDYEEPARRTTPKEKEREAGHGA